METKDVYNHAKKEQLIIKKHPCVYSKYRCIEKSLFYENVLDLTSFSQDLELFLGFFFFGYIFFRTEFPETVLAAPILF